MADAGPSCLANGSKVNQAILIDVDGLAYKCLNFGKIKLNSELDRFSMIGSKSLAIVFDVTSATFSSASIVHLLYLSKCHCMKFQALKF